MASELFRTFSLVLVGIGLPFVASYFVFEALLLVKAILAGKLSVLKAGPWLMIGIGMLGLLILMPLMFNNLLLLATGVFFLIAAVVVAFVASIDEMKMEYDKVIGGLNKAAVIGIGGEVIETTGNRRVGWGAEYTGTAVGVATMLGLVAFRDGSWLKTVRRLALAMFAITAVLFAIIDFFHL